MPNNPLTGKAGNVTRCNQILDYFEGNHETLEVDFASVLHWDEWTDEDRNEFKVRFPHITLHLIQRKIPSKKVFKYIVDYKIPKLFSVKDPIDLTTFYYRKQVRHIIEKNKYDTIIVSYATWGNLVDRSMGAYLILDTHDFITLQVKCQSFKNLGIGKQLEKEIKVLNKFDEIWTYSVEEQYIFEQFTSTKKVTLIPISFPQKMIRNKDVRFNVLYVASDNPHNQRSIEWYLSEVLPQLNGITTYIAGPICNKIGDYDGVVKLGIVEDVDKLYRHSKVTICPMLSGTGIKIKVLESLSYGLPVVTTRRGVDGLVNKSENGCIVADSAAEFAYQIRRLLSDEDYYQMHEQEGLSFHKLHYSIDAEKTVLDNVFLDGKVQTRN